MLNSRSSFVKQRSLWYLIPFSWLLLAAMFGIHVLSQVEYLPGGNRPPIAPFAIVGSIAFVFIYVLSAETLRALTEDWGWRARLHVFGFSCLATVASVAIVTNPRATALAAAIIFILILFWPAGIGMLRSKR